MRRSFEFCHNLSFKFCHNLCFFAFCHNLSFIDLLHFEFLNLVKIWVFQFCHNLIFLIFLQYSFFLWKSVLVKKVFWWNNFFVKTVFWWNIKRICERKKIMKKFRKFFLWNHFLFFFFEKKFIWQLKCFWGY